MTNSISPAPAPHVQPRQFVSASVKWDKPIKVKVENVVTDAMASAFASRMSPSTFAPANCLALLGPSGSGKTTLLRILAGLDQPTDGRVTFDGENALGLPVQKRNVGLVFQNYALFRHMTVLGNVAFGLKVRPREQRPSEKRSRSARSISSSLCSSADSRIAIQLSFPAVNANASPLPARLPSSRACCSSMSLSARSTHKCEKSSAAGSSRSTGRPDIPRCSSPTIRKRRSSSPTASW